MRYKHVIGKIIASIYAVTKIKFLFILMSLVTIEMALFHDDRVNLCRKL